MILVFLIVLIVALILANLFISIAKPRRKSERGFTNPSVSQPYEPEVLQETALTTVHEKTSVLDGKVLAVTQKLNLMNERVGNLEKAVADIVDHKIKTDTSTDVDFEKVDFRIKVLEQQMEEVKQPKEKQKTFYGKLDPSMEHKVKSLAFNKKA